MNNKKIINFGKFKLFNQIARGGMAEIFLGCSGSVESAHKFLVIKRILSVHSHNKEFNKMFQNEGKIAVNLNHSNIGSIYEFGIEKNQYFICMEYISGRNVRQLVKKLKSQKKVLSPAMCAHIIRCICNGLDYAHNCTDSITGQPLNIIHRDISPQNIMVSFGGDVKVIDFGIAKIDDSESTKVGVLKGKFEYMSPEQVRGKELDRQTDIFSLGNVLWELLANRKLFTGSNEIQLLKKIKSCEIPDLKKINPAIPDRLVEIVNKALSSNKNLRYQTMGEMGNDISIFLNKFYPDFTNTNFSSFIKEVYIEEILEERQTLKKYSQLLASSTSSRNGLSRRQSTSFNVSKFVGYSEELDKKQKKDDKDESTMTMTGGEGPSFYEESSQYTETQQEEPTQTEHEATNTVNQEITKTQFEDSLDSQGRITASSGRYTIVSDGYRNTIRDDSKESESLLHTSSRVNDEATHYQPWAKATRKKLSTKVRRRKKSLFQKAVIGLSACGLIFAAYIYRENIQNKVSRAAEDTHFDVSEQESKPVHKRESIPAPESASVPEAPTGSRKINSVKPLKRNKKANTSPLSRNILISTQPSGAQLWINGEKVNTVTPTSVMVPVDGFELLIKRLGYHDQTITLSATEIKQMIDFPLKRKESSKKKKRMIIME